MLKSPLYLPFLLKIGLLLGGLFGFGVKAQDQERVYLSASSQVVQLPAILTEMTWVHLSPLTNRLLASAFKGLPYDFFPAASYRYVAFLEFRNLTAKSRKIYLNWGLIDQIFFQVSHEGDWQTSGFLESYARRAVPEGRWNQQLTYLYLPAQTRAVCILMLANATSLPAKIPVQLYEEAAWENQMEVQHFYQGIFQGIMVLFSLCILIVYLTLGEKLYLTFFLYAFLFALSRLPAYGYFGPYLSPSPYTDEIWWLNLSQASAMMLLLFVRQALQTPRFTPFYDKLILVLIIARGLAWLGGWIIILSGLGIDFVNVVVRWIDVFTLPLGLWITIFFAWKGSLLARYLVIANLSILAGLTFTLLGAYQIIITPFYPYFLQAGALGQIFVICIGLGFRIRRWFEKEQKNQAKILVLQKEINHRLEDKVKKRTEELEKAYEEIRFRNDELNQQQEEVLSINNHLEELVRLRTLKIKKQNDQLREYAYFNAHKVRGPLARILGIMYLVKVAPPQSLAEITDLVNKLHDSAQELDLTIREINQILDEGEEED